jgi:hypothetical protein
VGYLPHKRSGVVKLRKLKINTVKKEYKTAGRNSAKTILSLVVALLTYRSAAPSKSAGIDLRLDSTTSAT